MKVLIIDQMHPSIVPLLENEGFEVHYKPQISRKEILKCIQHYHGLVIRSKTPMDMALLENADKLKFIARAGAGLDNIDLDFLESKGVALHHAPEGNRDAVAEHVMGMLLAFFNQLSQADAQVRRGIWDREGNRGIELAGKTVGIIGYGNMGEALAKRLRGFGVKILAYDKYKKGFGNHWVEECSLETIQEEVDIVSLHIPLTMETKNMFTPTLIDGFHKPFYLINTARGELIKFDTLNEALQNKKIKGALLDVLENEKLQTLSASQKLSFQRLTQRDNVMFSPHVAGWTFESYEKINQVLVAKIAGKWPIDQT